MVRDETCHNDKHKAKLRDEVAKILASDGMDFVKAVALADRIRTETRVKDLIEFSRAVHAEMDAIVSVARTGAPRIVNSVMFNTTYPCHSCARHIVAAGVKVVYFIEPYEKSLADDLHNDSIVQDPDVEAAWADLDQAGKVAFIHFEGVAPHRYTKLFQASASRKGKDGKALPTAPDSEKRVPEYLDDYRELEARVIDRLDKVGLAPVLASPTDSGDAA
jgi:deoxycytidylate deaminase